jgi:phage terminase small subunit
MPAKRRRKPRAKRVEKRKRAKLPALPAAALRAHAAVASLGPVPLAAPDVEGLSPKHRRFVIEYLVDQNGKRAAIRSGYSPLSAESTASEILSIPKVRAAIDAALEARAQEAGASVAEVMLLLTRIAKADLRRCVDEDGRLLPLHEMPEDVALAVSSVEVEELFSTALTPGPRGGMRKERVHVGYTTKVRLWDKTKAAELLGKHLRMWRETIEHSGPDGKPIEVKGSAEEAAKIDALLAKVEGLLDADRGA